MKLSLKRFLKRIPGMGTLLYLRGNPKKGLRLLVARNPKSAFTYIYETNQWKNHESRSGVGSTVEYTEMLRGHLVALVEELGIKRFLDAPCGDYHWFRLIPRTNDFFYVGGDIVPSLIESNREKYSDDKTEFQVLDIRNDTIPKAELWLCRDCLFHMSYKDIILVIDNFLASDVRYLLTSTHTECDANMNIFTSAFRQLNLELPPFNFPPAIRYIEDWIEGFPIRRLGLWERDHLAESLASNKLLRRYGRRMR